MGLTLRPNSSARFVFGHPTCDVFADGGLLPFLVAGLRIVDVLNY